MLSGEEQSRYTILPGALQSRAAVFHSLWKRAEQSRARGCRAVWKTADYSRGIPVISLVGHTAINKFYVRNALNFIGSNLKNITS
jgi:hypothetical protein